MKQQKTSNPGLSRRQFLGRTATAVAAFSVVPRHVLGGPKFIAPSEKINIAIIGCGGQGRTNVRSLFDHPYAQIIAVADPAERQDLHAFYYKSEAGRLPVKAEIEKHFSEKTPNYKVADYEDPVGYVRRVYSKKACETKDQCRYVYEFEPTRLRRRLYFQSAVRLFARHLCAHEPSSCPL